MTEPVSVRKARVLMIEDNEGDVGLFQWALAKAGVECELKVIGDGGAALELLRQESAAEEPSIPDLVILDLNLPKASGREVLAEIRSTAPFADVPVVVWTSSNAPADRAQLTSLRVHKYLVKPPDLNSFLKLGDAIKEVLETSSKH